MQPFAAKYHTTTPQLIEIAKKAKPGLLILDHLQSGALGGILKELAENYSGKVVIGRDLDVY
jgi:ribonuclease Z